MVPFRSYTRLIIGVAMVFFGAGGLLTLANTPISSSRMSDSLALADLYHATNGPNWTFGWDLNAQINTWYGVTLNQEGRVIGFDLNSNNLEGSIPEEIGMLTQLEIIGLHENNLQGNIPSTITYLINLTIVELNNNSLGGNIPENIDDLLNLQVLRLQNNNLDGSIPENLGNLYNAEELDFSNNNLSGCYPPSLDNLCSVNYISFLGNIGLPNNGDFDLFCQNQDGICLPCQHPDKPALKAMYHSLRGFLWYNSWDTSECDVCNWYGVFCDANGRVVTLDLDGTADDSIGGIELGNGLNGRIPPQIGDLTFLKKLILSQNRWISGGIPIELGQLSKLEILDLSNIAINLTGLPLITGPIPQEIGNLERLRILNLAENNLEGPLPSNLWTLLNLELLNLGANPIYDTLPEAISGLTSLKFLGIYDTNIYGDLPSNLAQLDSLRQIYMVENNFSGTLPPEYGNFSDIDYLYLSNNNLEGCIPSNWKNLCGVSINLSNNPSLIGGGDFEAFCTNNLGSCNVVMITGDTGPGSLRYAIATSVDGDSIFFDTSLSNQTIFLHPPSIQIDKKLYWLAGSSQNLTVSNQDSSNPIELLAINNKLIIDGLNLLGQNPDSFIIKILETGSLELRSLNMSNLLIDR